MIKYNIDNKNGVLNAELEVKGDVATITADVILLVSEIYSDMKAKNPDSAKDFKEYITMAIKDGVVFVSEEERKDIIKKKCEEIKAQLVEKVLDALFDSIGGWNDDTDTNGD